jgi:enoyl-CoA hydratase/carnithine racemase
MNDTVARNIADGVMTLRLNRPSKRNAISHSMLRRLQEELAVAADRHIHAVVIAGVGKCFSAGADISELSGTAEDQKFDDALGVVGEAIRSGPYLVIAAIHGACIGAAFDLACSCDARVCAETAFFEVPAVKLGLLYNPASIARLHRTLCGDALRRLLLLGERIDGKDARAASIATHIAREADVHNLAAFIARRSAAKPRSMIATKQFLAALDADNVDAAHWQSVRMELLGSAERRDAIQVARSNHS